MLESLSLTTSAVYLVAHACGDPASGGITRTTCRDRSIRVQRCDGSTIVCCFAACVGVIVFDTVLFVRVFAGSGYGASTSATRTSRTAARTVRQRPTTPSRARTHRTRIVVFTRPRQSSPDCRGNLRAGCLSGQAAGVRTRQTPADCKHSQQQDRTANPSIHTVLLLQMSDNTCTDIRNATTASTSHFLD